MPRSSNKSGQAALSKEELKFASSGLTYAPGNIFQRFITITEPLPVAETDPGIDTRAIKEGHDQERENGNPTKKDMDRINSLSRSGNLDPSSLYVFDAAPSTQRIDSLLTRMDVSSLKNYAKDAANGIPVMNSHSTGSGGGERQLPLGRSFWGGIEDDPGLKNSQRFVASAYMLRNNQANGRVNTDDIIAAIEAGTISDVSIGFSFQPGTSSRNFEDRTWMQCSICNQDFLRSDPWSEEPDQCNHWPGELYNREGSKTQELCYLNVVNARLAEYSLVYQGATDGAVILKAQRAAQSGLLNRSQLYHLEEVYNTRLLDRTSILLPDKLDRVVEKTKYHLQEEKEVVDAAQVIKKEIEIENDTETNIRSTKIPEIGGKAKNTMASTTKQKENNQAETEAAILKGERLALANLIKTLTESRAMSDGEVGIVKEAMGHLAAGAMDKANASLAKLLAYPNSQETLNLDMETSNDALHPQVMEPGDLDALTEEMEGNPHDWSSSTLDDQADEEGGLGGDVDGDGDALEIDANKVFKKRDGSDSIILLELTVTERQQYKALQDENKTLRRENRALKPMADIGERYRANLIEAASKQAARAGLDDTSESDVVRMCARLDIEDIERMFKQWKRQGDERLGQVDLNGQPLLIGGRQTAATDPNANAFENARAARGLPDPTPRKVEIGAYR